MSQCSYKPVMVGIHYSDVRKPVEVLERRTSSKGRKQFVSLSSLNLRAGLNIIKERIIISVSFSLWGDGNYQHQEDKPQVY